MTTPINIKRPIVNANGTLTRWGWEVLQSFWNATGGNQSVPTSELKLAALAPAGVSGKPQGDVSPVPVEHQHSDDLAPEAHAHAQSGDVGPL